MGCTFHTMLIVEDEGGSSQTWASSFKAHADQILDGSGLAVVKLLPLFKLGEAAVRAHLVEEYLNHCLCEVAAPKTNELVFVVDGPQADSLLMEVIDGPDIPGIRIIRRGADNTYELWRF